MLLGGPLLLSPVAPHLPVLRIPAAVAAPSEAPTQQSIQPTVSPACMMSLAGFILEVLNVADNILAPVLYQEYPVYIVSGSTSHLTLSYN